MAIDSEAGRCDARRAVLLPIFKRVVSAWWFYVLGAFALAALFAPAVEASWHVPHALSSWVGLLIMSFLIAPYFNLWRYARTDDWSYARQFAAWTYGVFGAIALILTLSMVDLPVPGGTVGWVAVSVATCLVTVLLVRHLTTGLADRVLRVTDPDHAEELAIRCDAELEREDLSGRRRAAVQLTLAHALVALSTVPGHEDAWHEAYLVLDDALGTDRAAVGPALEVLLQMVAALDLKDARAGDETGLKDTLELLMEIAEDAAASDDTALARAYAARGRSRWRRSRERRAEGDEIAGDALRRAAEDDLRRAVGASPRASDLHALNTLALVEVQMPRPLAGGLDESIRRCRSALVRLWLVGAEERMPGYLILADLLELRAQLTLETVPGGARSVRRVVDLALALRLSARLSGGEHAAEAHRRIARLQGLLRAGGGTLRVLDPRGRMFRRFLDDGAVTRSPSAAEIARAWATWAMQRGDVDDAADAWQAWLTATISDLRRRVLDDKRRRLPAIQADVAVAASWMVAAGRPADAALALEAGRAVLLTERVQRRGPGIEQRLRAAGEDELAQAWSDAGDALEAEDRASVGAGRRADPTPYASAEYLALLERDRLVRDIAERPGFDDVQPAPDLGDLADAAATGPLVYLAAADGAGFAVVVTAGGAEIRGVRLPRLDQAAVAEAVGELRAASTPFEIARVLRRILPWLWDSALEPIASELLPGGLVTLIPAGRLAELPLHAAVCTPGPDGVWRDRVPGLVLRYAPNARILHAADQVVAGLGDGATEVLSVAVPHALGERPLKHALRESASIAAVLGPDRVRSPRPATADAVAALLDRCLIWHFACHGVHEPLRPLESRLTLADSSLSLATIMGRRSGRRRLAVLSACQTARVDDAAPDELLGFPSALLQAGVAGVVSCLGDVEDAGAMLLVLRFFALIAAGAEPPRALTESQRWLRSSTNRELCAAFPEAYERPPGAPPEWDDDRRFAAPSTWALFTYTGA